MESVVRAAEGSFWHENIKFERTEPTGVFRSGFIGENGCLLGYVDADGERSTVYTRTLAPLVVSKGKRLEPAELVARINHRLLRGNLELNIDTGAIACPTSISLGESDLHPDGMEHLLYGNCRAMDRFFPTVNAVLFGNISPRKAINQVLQRQPKEPSDTCLDESLRTRLRDILRGWMN